MSQITTHILDVSQGIPAANVLVRLEMSVGGEWKELSRGATDVQGRLGSLATPDPLPKGTYRLVFDTNAYFTSQQISGFYPEVIVAFDVRETAEHYHVPLLLSPYGYSTYRGS
jgi:5-hydroxyisourate hydrolase